MKNPTLFDIPAEKVERVRIRDGKFATKKQKAQDDRIHRAKIIELENASLKRQIKNKDYLIEILTDKLKNL